MEWICLTSSCLCTSGLNYFMHFFFPALLSSTCRLSQTIRCSTHLVSGLINTLKFVAVSERSRRYILFNIAQRASWFTVFRLVLSCTSCFKIVFFFSCSLLFFWREMSVFMGIITLYSFARAHPWFFFHHLHPQ